MSRVKFLDLYKNYETMKPEIDNAIQNVINTSQYIEGNEKRLFEQEFAQFVGVKHCIGVANGTDALEIGIQAFEFPEGSEIITQPNSFIATCLGISHNNLVPVFVDIDPKTLMIDTTQIESKITEKTKALCIVHLYGCCPNMNEILRIMKKHKLILIEDCAQAHGAKYNNQAAGSFGDVSCFSFYPGKNLGCFGDGGAICTNRDDIYSRMKLIYNMGSEKKYYHTILGRNSRLDTLQAAVLRVKLRSLEKNNEKRRNIAGLYLKHLAMCDGIVLPNILDECMPVWHLFVIRIIKSNRDTFQKFLASRGIDTIIHYPIPIHKQSAYSEFQVNSYPICEETCTQIVSLPMYPELSDSDVLYVCSVIQEFFQVYV